MEYPFVLRSVECIIFSELHLLRVHSIFSDLREIARSNPEHSRQLNLKYAMYSILPAYKWWIFAVVPDSTNDLEKIDSSCKSRSQHWILMNPRNISGLGTLFQCIQPTKRNFTVCIHNRNVGFRKYLVTKRWEESGIIFVHAHVWFVHNSVSILTLVLFSLSTKM